MLNKIILYCRALHKGELLKRIEYKLKDIFKYFYIRNFFTNKDVKCNFRNVEIDIPNLNYEKHDYYYVFNKKINYNDIKQKLFYSSNFWRKEKLSYYDDVKIVWEINRLQFLLPIAMKYKITKNSYYKELIMDTLDFWEEKNKFEYGINWTNNLEVAVRAINIALCLIILQDKKLDDKYSSLLYLHALYIYNEINYSKYCIPNNHLIGEATALLFLSNFLNTKKQIKWQKRAIKIIKENIDIIDEDGLSKENSFSYQFFVTKMYIISLIFIHDKNLFDIVNSRILKSLNLLKYTLINNNKVINYGDNDDSFLFSLYNEYNLHKDIKLYYDMFYENKLSGETLLVNELINSINRSNAITYGEKKDDIYIINEKVFIYKSNHKLLFFNATNIAGHAHNDSLSIYLVVNGKEVLIDSGTYSYNLDEKKRKYYKSRKAHNTIQIEEERNAINVSSFRWINKYKSNLKLIDDNENYIQVIGKIIGICNRDIKIYKKENKIEISDLNIVNDMLKNNWITSLKNRNVCNNLLKIDDIEIKFEENVTIQEEKTLISTKYLEEKEAFLYKVKTNSNKLLTIITW